MQYSLFEHISVRFTQKINFKGEEEEEGSFGKICFQFWFAVAM